MKHSKKLLSLCLAMAMTVALAGCGGNTSSSTSQGDASQSAQSSADQSQGEEATGLKIAIVSSPNSVDDGSFNEDNYNGILNFIASRGDIDTVTPIQETSGDTAAVAQLVGEIVADYDVIVATGFQSAGIGPVAQDNPDKYFILVDTFPSDAEGVTMEEGLENVYAMQFAEQESGFFAGVAAALETQSGQGGCGDRPALPLQRELSVRL